MTDMRRASGPTDELGVDADRWGLLTVQVLVRCLLGLCVLLAGCGGSSSGPGPLAGTYTGYMQEIGNGRTLDYSLAQAVTVTESALGPLDALTFTSDAFPTFKAVVVSQGPAAVNLELVGIDGAGQLELEEVAFILDDNGQWVLLIQTAAAKPSGTDAGLVQYVSYEPSNAPPANAVAAVAYLDKMFALASLVLAH